METIDKEKEPLLIPAFAIKGHTDEEDLLLLGGSSKKRKFHLGQWVKWVSTRYRKPFDPQSDEDFWYDPKRSLTWIHNLWELPNWGLLSHYFNCGIGLSMLSTPVTYYLVESLDASAAVTNTYSALTYLPWCLKVFMGLQSDLVPLMGVHRLSYFIIGWIVFILSNIWLAIMVKPGIIGTLLLSFVMTMGLLYADTVADAIVLECSRYESDKEKGRMRTHCYVVRQVGATIGSIAGALIYNSTSDGGTWGWGLSIQGCFILQALLPACTILPLILFMYELPILSNKNLSSLCHEMFEFIAHDGVWIPMLFVYFYGLSYVSNPSWYNFLYDGLEFSDFQVGMLYTIGSLFSVLGLVAYEKYFFKSSWRRLFLWTTIVSGIFSFLQVLLVTGQTFGLPKIIFATGDISLQGFFQYVAFMPFCVMFFSMIPGGTEGTIYALISTWQNVSGEVATGIGTTLACGVNVSDNAIENHNWSGVLKLTLITSGIQLLPVFFIYGESPSGIKFLPDNIDETKAQCRNPNRRSNAGAYLFFALFGGSIVASILQSLYVIFYPNSC